MLEFIFKNWEVVAGSTGAVFGLYTFFDSVKVRKSEFKLTQANTAYDMIKDIHEHDKAKMAIKMLDWFEVDLDEDEEKPNSPGLEKITYDRLLKSMKQLNEDRNAFKTMSKEMKTMLDCFDWFFYYVDRLEQSILDGQITFENVYYVFLPYYDKCSATKESREIFEKFCERRGYKLIIDFWKRFPETTFEKIVKTVSMHIPFTKRKVELEPYL